jgi:hypothetical protein
MIDRDNTHDKLILAFQEYFKWQSKFENKGSDESGIKSRNALLEIRKLCTLRRNEIQEARQKRRALRNSKKEKS